MIDRESVIRQLTQHIARADYIETDWMDCVSVPMLRGALTLLKEQEPKILTLEEVKKLSDHDVAYIETTISSFVNPAIYQPENGNDDYACVVSTWLKSGFYAWNTYGKDWRLWTHKPTQEQMEAAPWQE